ncbi:MAG: mechanosensitive ion channel [Candidatus Heimdallarchaeota archaeon]|nr:MAG: mechanosensitive ion channel [Candidatus Heimdallarchaeota archaeon]
MISQWANELSDLMELFLYWLDILALFVIIIGFLLLIWFGGKILKSFTNWVLKTSPDVKNAVNLIISIIQIFIATLGSFTLLGADEDFILGFSALLAAVVGIASASVASNVFAGLYLIVARPFTIGDLIETQDTVGIVEEIGLNFTKIVQIDRTSVIIPNSSLLNASLLNYSVKIPHGENKGLLKTLESINVIPVELSQDTRYIKFRFKIEVQLNIVEPPISIKALKQRLDKICEEFSPVYGIKPEYYLGKYDFRQKVYILIYAQNAYAIFNSWPYLMESITETIFTELQEGEFT